MTGDGTTFKADDHISQFVALSWRENLINQHALVNTSQPFQRNVITFQGKSKCTQTLASTKPTSFGIVLQHNFSLHLSGMLLGIGYLNIFQNVLLHYLHAGAD